MRVIPPQPFAPSGKGRLARVPQAAPCGHFASLVRSIATQSARLPSESFAFCGAFLANRQIGFGCVRIAIRPFPRRCVGAAPCGHFASLVRSIAAQSARLPSESFAFFGAFLRAISPCVAILYDAAARRLHLPCRPAAMRIMCGIKALVLAGEGEDFIRTVVS